MMIVFVKSFKLSLLLRRFFYDYIYRASDESDDGDYIYAQRHLEQRMKM